MTLGDASGYPARGAAPCDGISWPPRPAVALSRAVIRAAPCLGAVLRVSLGTGLRPCPSTAPCMWTCGCSPVVAFSRRTAARLAERGMASRRLSVHVAGRIDSHALEECRDAGSGMLCRAKRGRVLTSARLSDAQSAPAYRGRRMMTSIPPYCLSPLICAKALSVVHIAHAFTRRASAMCIQSTGPIPTCRYLLPLRTCGVAPL